MEALEQRTVAKVSSRLVPFLILCYFVAYLDRVNVSFAALTMNKDVGLSASSFGFGAGIFFLAYFLFEHHLLASSSSAPGLLLDMVVVSAVTIAVSALTYRYVERPFLQPSGEPKRRRLVAPAAMAAAPTRP